MQDSSHPQARDITEQTNPLTPTLSVEDVSDDRPNSRDDSQSPLGKELANPAQSPTTGNECDVSGSEDLSIREELNLYQMLDEPLAHDHSLTATKKS
ncbi:hypothetical protein HO133_006163 [Letharia lupina]|uniref:Uncharacterized protein n=1 Tax=Letharia lupina TaxID=560253 RepID=A0A8H6C796_9LECA|nr:uncharacterized protein HO133_006163 [Letharia lupina]KAF6218202.1 hypothetical protein HO133_006163 [Letharia lupina]